MVVSASTNQVWTKITIKSYAWSFAIQNSDPDPCSVMYNDFDGELGLAHYKTINQEPYKTASQASQ